MKVFISVLDPSAKLYVSRMMPYINYDVFSTSRDLGTTVVSLDEMSTIGVPSLGRFFLKFISIVRFLASCKIDVAILCDSPDLNIILGVMLRGMRKDAKIVYFIPPTVWAWRPERKRVVEENFDLVLYLLPFEKEIWTKNGIYVGHPMCKIIRDEMREWREQMVLGKSKTTPTRRKLAFLPGSRVSEIKNHVDIVGNIWKLMKDTDIMIPTDYPWFFPRPYKTFPSKLSRWIMYCSDVVLTASGTASLESALLGKPSVIFYKLPRTAYEIARRMVKVKFISLPNLILAEGVFPELIQDRAEPGAICDEIRRVEGKDFSEISNRLFEVLEGLDFGEIVGVIFA